MSTPGPQPDRLDLELLAAGRLVRVNALAFGVSCGLLAGSTLLLATWVLLVKGGPSPGPHLSLLGQYFPGYRVSLAGGLIGFAYAFLTGFALGASGARIYELVATWRESRRTPLP